MRQEVLKQGLNSEKSTIGQLYELANAIEEAMMAIQGYIIHVHIVHSLCDLYFMREVNVLHPSLHITVILN